jgi:hypothetical protein
MQIETTAATNLRNPLEGSASAAASRARSERAVVSEDRVVISPRARALAAAQSGTSQELNTSRAGTEFRTQQTGSDSVRISARAQDLSAGATNAAINASRADLSMFSGSALQSTDFDALRSRQP